MQGTFVNVIAILLGTGLGLIIKRWFTRTSFLGDCSDLIMQGMGMAVVIIGISNALESENMLLVIVSIAIGGLLGYLIGIERRLDRLGEIIENKFSRNKENTSMSQSFVTASLIFCVGSMAIVGSLDAGIKGDYLTLYAKSLLDGITSIILSSTLGVGVAFSAFAVLIYQGSITLMSNLLQPLLTEMMINDMTAVGGILIMGIGITMIGIKKLNVGNLLPAIAIPAIYYPLAELASCIIK